MIRNKRLCVSVAVIIGISISILVGLVSVSYGSDQYQKPLRPLKILCVVGSFPSLPETFILNQLIGLIDRGHRVAIYASQKGQQKMHPDLIKYRLLDYTYYGELPPDIDSYDIILCQFGTLGNQFLPIKKELGLKAKLVTCFRGHDITREIQEKGERVYDQLFAQGDLFLPVCTYFKDILIDLGCPPEKIKVHHSGIDLDRFAFRDTEISDIEMRDTKIRERKKESITIVSVNRLIPKKGTVYAINAVRLLSKKYPTLQYKIMGDGPLRQQLMAHVNEHKMHRAIKLLGWGTHDEVAALLQRADIVVLPSLTGADGNEEGIPNILKEAMAVGIPVVSTYHAGIAELVKDGETGFLVACANSKELARKIEYLIEHPEVRAQMGIAGRACVEQEYDTNKLNDQLVDYFYALLDTSHIDQPLVYF